MGVQKYDVFLSVCTASTSGGGAAEQGMGATAERQRQGGAAHGSRAGAQASGDRASAGG